MCVCELAGLYEIVNEIARSPTSEGLLHFQFFRQRQKLQDCALIHSAPQRLLSLSEEPSDSVRHVIVALPDIQLLSNVGIVGQRVVSVQLRGELYQLFLELCQWSRFVRCRVPQ